MTEVLMTVAVMTGTVLFLTGLILAARAVVMVRGEATITIEGRDDPLRVELGRKLLGILSDAGIAIPSACGGKGTCGSCRVRVIGELDPPLAIERDFLDSHALANNARLACQVTVRGDLDVALPSGPALARAFEARVRSTRNLTPLIKEIVLDLPGDQPFEFRAGSFIQVTCPAYRSKLGDLPIDESVRDEWQRLGVQELVATCAEPATRAYSLANHRGEGPIATLVVRLALPPPGSPAGTPPGQVSTYLFGRAPGDVVSIAGPFGHFVATDSDREMVFVGGGAGIAPLRAHIFEQLEVLDTGRTLSFWYGARTRKDIVYSDDFDRLAAEHPNFRWSVALSEPASDTTWTGPTGYIHQHLYSAFLAEHPRPADCEYYLCGPPLMVRAVVAMLEKLSVERESIFCDDFGG